VGIEVGPKVGTCVGMVVTSAVSDDVGVIEVKVGI
jgi:hypothetical protein